MWELRDNMISRKKILLQLYRIIRFYLFENVKNSMAITTIQKSVKNKHVSRWWEVNIFCIARRIKIKILKLILV